MNTTQENWQIAHEYKQRRLNFLMGIDEEEMILCNFCGAYHKATEVQEMETYSNGRREIACIDCIQYLTEYLKNNE